MKVSELQNKDIADYLRVDAQEEAVTIDLLKSASISYVKNYTGLTTEELDEFEDITIVVLILCADMFDNRQMTVPVHGVNKVIQSILDLHCRNFM